MGVVGGLETMTTASQENGGKSDGGDHKGARRNIVVCCAVQHGRNAYSASNGEKKTIIQDSLGTTTHTVHFRKTPQEKLDLSFNSILPQFREERGKLFTSQPSSDCTVFLRFDVESFLVQLLSAGGVAFLQVTLQSVAPSLVVVNSNPPNIVAGPRR